MYKPPIRQRIEPGTSVLWSRSGNSYERTYRSKVTRKLQKCLYKPPSRHRIKPGTSVIWSRSDSRTYRSNMINKRASLLHFREPLYMRWQCEPCAYSPTHINGFISYHVLGNRTVWVVPLQWRHTRGLPSICWPVSLSACYPLKQLAWQHYSNETRGRRGLFQSTIFYFPLRPTITMKKNWVKYPLYRRLCEFI